MVNKCKGFIFLHYRNGYASCTREEAEERKASIQKQYGSFKLSEIQEAELTYEDGHLVSYRPIDNKPSIIPVGFL
jgi:hypothetical protein